MKEKLVCVLVNIMDLMTSCDSSCCFSLLYCWKYETSLNFVLHSVSIWYIFVSMMAKYKVTGQKTWKTAKMMHPSSNCKLCSAQYSVFNPVVNNDASSCSNYFCPVFRCWRKQAMGGSFRFLFSCSCTNNKNINLSIFYGPVITPNGLYHKEFASVKVIPPHPTENRKHQLTVREIF